MTATPCTCALCNSEFLATTSYGVCPSCISSYNLREWDRLSSAKRTLKRVGVPLTLNLREWLGIISDFKGRCAYCLEVRFDSIETVERSKGLVLGNVVPICRVCSHHRRHGFQTALDRVQRYLVGDVSLLPDEDDGIA